jgi:hypothetical protein
MVSTEHWWDGGGSLGTESGIARRHSRQEPAKTDFEEAARKWQTASKHSCEAYTATAACRQHLALVVLIKINGLHVGSTQKLWIPTDSLRMRYRMTMPYVGPLPLSLFFIFILFSLEKFRAQLSFY